MKIEDKRPVEKKAFSELKEGDCFEYAEAFYMKTEEIEIVTIASYSKANAITIATGSLTHVDPYVIVKYLDKAKFVLE